MSISFISTPALISPVFYIYLHIRLTDGSPFYVGKGNGRRATRTQHRNNWWHNIVNKHGFDIIMLEEGLTEEQALEKEIYWINRIGRKDQGKGPLVNMTDGGEGKSGNVTSDETKKKLSKLNKGANNAFYGKKHSEETINKMKTLLAKRVVSDETKLKMSLSHTGQKRTEEQKLRMKIAQIKIANLKRYNNDNI